MKNIFFVFSAMFFLISCNQAQNSSVQAQNSSTQTQTSHDKSAVFYDIKGEKLAAVMKSDEEWKAELSAQEYEVLREDGTERAFTGDLLTNKEEGVYTCGGCGLPLFASDAKFKSGTGWPSFFQPITEGHVGEITDNRYGMRRIEVECNRCGGHLGHVFDDGPAPTGLRYCINSVSLDFEPVKLKDVKVKKP